MISLNNRTLTTWIEVTLLCSLLFLFRLYASIPVEDSGDSFVKWYEVKRLYHGLHYSRLDHHTMRWGINFPTLVFQKIFGTAPSIYYLAPATVATGAAFFLYKIALNLHGRVLAIGAMLLFSFHPVIINASSQLFPGIFSCCYILGSIYFLLAYSEQQKMYYIVFSAFFLFLGYGAKLTNLFFLPAIFIYIAFILKEYKTICIYLSILLLGYCLETLWIDSILGDYSFPGRLALAGGHLNFIQSGFTTESFFSGIVDRWAILPNYMYLHSFTGFFAAFFFLLNRNKYPRESLVALAYISVTFLITFGICSLDPVHFLLPNRPRYINVTIPLSLLLTLCFSSFSYKYRYMLLVFFLLAFPYSKSIAHLIHSPLHRQFYTINSYREQVVSRLDEGYCLAFLKEKHARLYRAMFVEDHYAMGLNGKKAVTIYSVPAGATKFNTSSTMYLLTVNKNIFPKGIVSPYPKEYVFSVHDLSVNELSFDSKWEQVW